MHCLWIDLDRPPIGGRFFFGDVMDTLFARNNMGGMRATLFGFFYEEILRKHFESLDYEIRNGKPQVFWRDINEVLKSENDMASGLNKALRNKKSSGVYAIPDGLFEKDGKFYIWEAKNWIPELWDSPFSKAVLDFPWLLAEACTYRGDRIKIDGFMISWWEVNKTIKRVENEINKLITPRSLVVVDTKPVLQELIDTKPAWYLDIIESRRKNLDEFFQGLLGKRQRSSPACSTQPRKKGRRR